jgi:hypothetical protein
MARSFKISLIVLGIVAAYLVLNVAVYTDCIGLPPASGP